MLGYNVAIPEAKSTYGLAEVGEEFWRSDLQCQGDEESLEDCDGKENPGCTRGEVAGVTCFLGGETITIVFNSNTIYCSGSRSHIYNNKYTYNYNYNYNHNYNYNFNYYSDYYSEYNFSSARF